jgi:hypothetical protein
MLIAIILHATYTGSQFVLFPPMSTGIENIQFTGVFMALLWIVAALLMVVKPRDMTNESAYKLPNMSRSELAS